MSLTVSKYLIYEVIWWSSDIGEGHKNLKKLPKLWMTFYKSKKNNYFLSSRKERLKLFKQKTFERIVWTIKIPWQIFCFTKLGNYEKADKS